MTDLIPTCPHCGKADYETFRAGDGELSVRQVSHIGCVVTLWAQMETVRDQLVRVRQVARLMEGVE